MKRVEMRSASSGIHLGHVFDDGPPPIPRRHCIDGNVLKFVSDAGKRGGISTPCSSAGRRAILGVSFQQNRGLPDKPGKGASG